MKAILAITSLAIPTSLLADVSLHGSASKCFTPVEASSSSKVPDNHENCIRADLKTCLMFRLPNGEALKLGNLIHKDSLWNFGTKVSQKISDEDLNLIALEPGQGL